MPGLISSAAPGKKAAPKAPARRRPVPTGPAPSAQTTPSAAASAPPPSPPPTQAPVAELISQLEEPTRPSPVQSRPAPSEPVREPEVEQSQDRTIEPEPFQNTVAETLTERDIVEPTVLTPEPTQRTQTPQTVKPARGRRDFQEVDQSQDQPQGREDGYAASLLTSIEAGRPAQTQQEQAGNRKKPKSRNGCQSCKLRRVKCDEGKPGCKKCALIGVKCIYVPVNGTAVGQSKVTTASSTTSGKRVRVDTSLAEASRPAKRPKRSSARSNAIVQAVARGEEDTTRSAEENAVGDGSEDTTKEQNASSRRKSARRPATVPRNTRGRPLSAATIVDSDNEDEAAQTSESAEDEVASPRPARKKTKGKRKKSRSRNPEAEGEEEQQSPDEDDPELHEHDTNTLSMYALSYDTKHGKMSDRGQKMAEIDWEQVAQDRRAAAEAPPGTTRDGVTRSVENPDGIQAETQADSTTGEQEGTPEGETETNAPEASENVNAHIGFVIGADGQIEVDEATRTIDRTAAAEAAVTSGQPIEEVNDLTVQINRTTWINDNKRDVLDRVPAWKWKSDPWSEEETDRFYEALAMFGTDFFIISKMFPPKTRRMIKAKFNREERLEPLRINDALNGKYTKPMDLEHYSQQTGKDLSVYRQYEGIEHAQAIINESMKEKQDAMTTTIQQEAALAEEKAEKEKQQKKEKTRARRKTKKPQGGGTMGGGPDEAGD